VASVYKRSADAKRGRLGKWTCSYLGADGKRHSKAGYVDKSLSIQLANELERYEREVNEGRVDATEKARTVATHKPIGDHAADYEKQLLAKGDDPKHCQHIRGAIVRLLESAAVASVADLAPDRIGLALGRMRAAKKSARTCNHALQAVKSFAAWLYQAGRIKVVPPGLRGVKPFNIAADRRWVRRALTPDEMDRLVAAAQAGQPIKLSRRGRQYAARFMSGPERGCLYLLALGTGFRANELRSLAPEAFSLDGDSPTITLKAEHSKNGKGAVQPITRALADHLRPFVEGKPPGSPVLPVPVRTAQMLRFDLAAAGIPERDAQGRVVDFHATRMSFITRLINSGANPKVAQMLARHSTITLTLGVYTSMSDEDCRKALEG
jgi:integrase/recombinase XerD